MVRRPLSALTLCWSSSYCAGLFAGMVVLFVHKIVPLIAD
jgi:hypothetical protein